MARNLALLLVTMATMCGLFELYLARRHSVEQEALRNRYPERELCTRRAADPRLIYETVPGERCGANSAGFRDREHALEKPEGVFRIALIGDSVAEGYGVTVGERFGDLLERSLNAEPHRSGVEVLNFARGGYTTSQELVVLETTALRFDPDLILWSYGLNDPAHPLFHDADGELGRYYFEPAWHGLFFIERILFRLRERYATNRCGGEFYGLLHCAYRDAIVRNLGELSEVARRNDLPVVFLIHPLIEGDSFSSYRFRDIHADLAAIAAEAGLTAIDLLPAVEPWQPKELQRDPLEPHPDPLHPNPKGHRLFAAYILERLRDGGLIPGL